MKTRIYYIATFSIGILLTACGGDNSTNESLDDLLLKRDSLKAELLLVNESIAELDTTKEDYTPIVSVEDLVVKEFVHKVEVQGSVESDKDALINAEASGTIRVIHVKEGQRVSQGQSLITIDSQILQSTIEEVENSLELATYMYEKQEKLMEEGVGVEIEYETAKNNKLALEKKLKTMQSQRGKTVVKAPFSGIVDNIMVNIGEMAVPQFPLLRIVNNKEVNIKASVSESLLATIKLGTEVELEIPSLNDTIIRTKVSYVGQYIDPVNRTFVIRIDIKNNSLLIPNQLAKVNVTDFQQKDALVVNNEAILQDTENNNYIYVLTDKKEDDYGVRKVYVDVMKQYKGESSINPIKQGDLSEDDQVVVRGAKGITESDRVKLQ